jgi:formylglycine-generating enzyme required for sulfatase activity
MMGSPKSEPNHHSRETLHLRQIGRRFAIASQEVTKEQFSRFQQDCSDIWKTDITGFSKTSDSPQVGMSWYEATAYCNWLSNKEGIPEEEWCYETNAVGKFDAGMRPKANYLELAGYQLPSEAEWECACRAGTRTSRSFGSSEALLPLYAWCQTNGMNQAWPVGLLCPNDAGMFDMHGNVAEWCHERLKNYVTINSTVTEDSGDCDPVTDSAPRVVRGSSFFLLAVTVRSANRDGDPPASRSGFLGFRPARTYP